MKNFFASLLGTLFGLVIFLVGGVMLAAVAIGVMIAFQEKPVIVRDGAYLVFDLTANITDSPPEMDGGSLGALLADPDAPETLQLRTVTRALRAAAQDKRIAGIFIQGQLAPDGYGTGMAALKEVRAALADFKASGKPVVAYLDSATTRDFYLAAGATDLVFDPYGSLLMPGLASEPTFYAGAFERFGVGVQVTKVGSYKSYAEPFVRKDLSPENREQLQKLLDDLWSDLVSDLAGDRNLAASAVQELVDAEGVIAPDVALKAGLVNRIAYRDEVLQGLKEATGVFESDETFKQVRLADYARTLSKTAGTPQIESPKHASHGRARRIAIVYAEGAIVDGEGGSGEVGGEGFAREVRALRQDDDVAAIVLRVNSPGGSASASEHIQRELRLAAEAKPVVVSMGSYAASGGYWISTYGQRIFAEPTTITGSIGVVGIHFDIQKLGNDLGLTWDGVKTGRFADITTVTRPKSLEELAVYQRMVNWIYGEFIRKVSEGRNIELEEVRRIAEGRVWSGAEALKLGLVDELGGLDQAIAHAAAQADLGNDYEIEEYPRTQTLTELVEAVLESRRPEMARSGVVSQVISQLKKQAAVVGQFNDPRGIYARLPFEIIVR